jgi:hypothetical protein
MAVGAPVSLMNTSRSGSRSSWPSIHASRRFRSSGRSCSAAWAVFFDGHIAAVEEGPDRAHARCDVPFRREALLHLRECDVRCRFNGAEQEGAMRIQLRATGLSFWACRALASVPSPTDPSDGSRDPNP